MRQIWILSLAALWLGGCIAVPKQAFNPARHPDIQSIGIADVEYNHKLTIRRNNPVFALIGVSGLMMQQVVIEKRSSSYQARVGDLASACESFVLQKLQASLSRQGYTVHALHTDFWQAMKLVHAHRLPDVDAVLRIKIKRLGFRAASINTPYEPSLMISVQMISPTSQEVLYEDTIAIGYKPSDYRMTILDYDRKPHAYLKFSDLIEHAPQSKTGIFIALQHSVERISHDLGNKHAITLVKKYPDKTVPLRD